MNTNTDDASRVAPRPLEGSLSGLWLTPAWTLEERLERILKIGQRINGYIEFMSKISSLNGTSTEAKERAVAAFYERLVVLERQLGLIQENLRLG